MGLEPIRPYGQGILSPPRLPITTIPQGFNTAKVQCFYYITKLFLLKDVNKSNYSPEPLL